VTPADPDWRARVETTFAAAGFLQLLGARLIEAAPGRCTIEAGFRPDLTQHHGLFHAGVLTTLADNAAGLAALSLMPPEAEVLSVEFKLSFLRPGAGVAAIARGAVLKPGRTLTVCRADVHMRQADGGEVLAATMLATMISAAPQAS
jgi:uncharacterized protein (TIGR00369 family)